MRPLVGGMKQVAQFCLISTVVVVVVSIVATISTASRCTRLICLSLATYRLFPVKNGIW